MSAAPLPALRPEAAWIGALPAPVVVILGARVRWANAAALALLRADSEQEVVGRDVADWIHPLDLHRALARIRRAETDDVTNPPTMLRAFDCRGGDMVVAMTSSHIVCQGDDGPEPGVLAAFMDMSRQAAMTARLRETNDDFRRMMDTMPDVFYRTDAQGVTRYVCPAVKNVLGYDARDIVGRPASDFYPDPAEREPLVEAIRRDGFVRDFPGRMRRKDGVVIDISISTRALYDEQGEYAGVEGIWRDISERKAMERELERLANNDHLTGALSRRCILEHLDQALMRRHDRRAACAVLLLDLDHFKQVNDTHGHALGDAALRQFVTLVDTLRRGEDHFGRLGGEEFLLLLPDADLPAACHAAERIRAAVQDLPLRLGANGVLRLTVSIGLTVIGPDDTDPAAVLERADTALYQAKDAGRNQVAHVPAPEPRCAHQPHQAHPQPPTTITTTTTGI